MKTGVIERKGRIEDLDRSFDLAFWQAQTPQARFAAAWELIVHAYRVKGQDVRQLRLQRSVETFQRQPHLIDADSLSSKDKASKQHRAKRKSGKSGRKR